MRLFMTFLICTSLFSPVHATEPDFENLSRHIDQISKKVALSFKVMRNQTDGRIQIQKNCKNCRKEMQLRHVENRARDIEHFLARFIKMHGIYSTPVSGDIHQFNSQSNLSETLTSLNFKFDIITSLNRITLPKVSANSAIKDYDQIYNSLNRLELLLTSMGAQPIAPQHVLLRAEQIQAIIHHIYGNAPDVVMVPIQSIETKAPADVYAESLVLWQLLAELLANENSTLVLSIPKNPADIITPRDIYELNGNILSDLVAHAKEKQIELPNTYFAEKLNASPTHVWRSINHSVRVIRGLNQG